jgi:chromosome segregation ATPase
MDREAMVGRVKSDIEICEKNIADWQQRIVGAEGALDCLRLMLSEFELTKDEMDADMVKFRAKLETDKQQYHERHKHHEQLCAVCREGDHR